MRQLLRQYIVAISVGVTLILVAWLLLRTTVKDSGIETSATDEHVSSTKAVIDSIRSIGQWELMSLDVQTEVDTVCDAWFGLRHNRLTRRYHGRISLGIDLSQLPSSPSLPPLRGDRGGAWVCLPPVKVLDENFIDESLTELIVCDDSDMEQSPEIRRDMLQRARQKMLKEVVTPARLAECDDKAHQELDRLLKLAR